MSEWVPEDGLIFEELLLTTNEYLTYTEEENSANEEEINNSDEDNNSDENNDEKVYLSSIPLIIQPPEVLDPAITLRRCLVQEQSVLATEFVVTTLTRQ